VHAYFKRQRASLVLGRELEKKLKKKLQMFSRIVTSIIHGLIFSLVTLFWKQFGDLIFGNF